VEGEGASEATCCEQWEGEFWESLRPPQSDPSSPSAHLPPEQVQNQKAAFRKPPHIVLKGVKTTLEAPDMVDLELATKKAAPRFELGKITIFSVFSTIYGVKCAKTAPNTGVRFKLTFRSPSTGGKISALNASPNWVERR
jgi:hypothetical protein